MKNTWPKLSANLPGLRRPNHCQACDQFTHKTLELWREHDDNDQPTPIVVCLCHACAEQIINPHPRLYSPIEKNTPVPGAMEDLCTTCVHRADLTCKNPLLKANGGQGLTIITPEPPTTGFWDGCDKSGRRTGGRLVLYSAPAIYCEGNPQAGDKDKLTEEHRRLIQLAREAREQKP